MHYKGIMWLMLGILLTGCTAVNNQQPDKLVRQAIQQNITKYNQYNLSGEIKFRLEENKNTSAKEKQQDNISSVHDLETLTFVLKIKIQLVTKKIFLQNQVCMMMNQCLKKPSLKI